MKFENACSARRRRSPPVSDVNWSMLIESPTNSSPMSVAAAVPAVR